MDNINNNLEFSDSYIMDLLMRIDKMQKEAVISEEGNCVTCQNALFSFTNNTVPLSIGLKCGGELTAKIGVSNTITTYFKVESIRACRYITLRLLEADDTNTLTATSYTLTIDGNCICYIECFDPISTTSCNLQTL